MWEELIWPHLANAVAQGRLHTTGSGILFDFVKPSKHPRLAKYKVASANRNYAVAHLKTTVHAAFIKDLYEDFSEYIESLLASAARKGLDPNRLIGEHSLIGEHKMTLDANELLACGSWDKVVELITQNVFRRLEGARSTRNIIEGIDKKLALGINRGILSTALPYLDARHLLVHRNGVVDGQFAKAYPTLGFKAGDSIELKWQFVDAARKSIVGLVQHFDERAVAVDVVHPRDLQP